ncbi:MAG: GNAT family N-acetyltransferase [Anaerolineae bacterium]
MAFTIAPLTAADREVVRRVLATRWGSAEMVVHGVSFQADGLPGFAAWLGGDRSEETLGGLVTYHVLGDSCEIVTLDSLREGIGIGTALVEAVKTAACAAGCRRLWLITTNDNLPALRFYQKRGFRIVAVHPGAVDAARVRKPSIPLVGLAGIPLHDEIELALTFTDS